MLGDDQDVCITSELRGATDSARASREPNPSVET